MFAERGIIQLPIIQPDNEIANANKEVCPTCQRNVVLLSAYRRDSIDKNDIWLRRNEVLRLCSNCGAELRIETFY